MRKRIEMGLVILALAIMGAASAQTGSEIMVPEISGVRAFGIPDNEALSFTRAMGAGWNLGNTFDAFVEGDVKDDLTVEAAWCGVYTTEAMIAAVHDAGFSTIRVPVSWHNHVDADFNIRPAWLDRVRQVVDWALARDMTVIVNIHHDLMEDYLYPTEACFEVSERYVTRVWTQLAARFADCGERLVFESMNEPRVAGTEYEWRFDGGIAACREAADCINRLNQAFVDTVRAAGGNNAARYLMVPAYDASPDNAVSDYFRLPDDPAENRLIVSAHAYTPYAFALQPDGVAEFSLDDAAQTGEIDRFMDALYARFIARGVPVVIGEFGARDRGGNIQARTDYAARYAAAAAARGMPCVWWDNHAFTGDDELFAIFDRRALAWPHPSIVEALTRYAVGTR